jgi:cytidine deaminase
MKLASVAQHLSVHPPIRLSSTEVRLGASSPPKFASQPDSPSQLPFWKRVKEWGRGVLLQIRALFDPKLRLFSLYKLYPDNVKVAESPSVKLTDKDTVLAKALEAHQLSLKNKILGNYSDDYRATSIQLENGLWSTATNLEMFPAEYSLCGERSAVVTAWNKALQRLDLDHLKTLSKEELQGVREGLKVKRVVMTSSGNSDFIQTCSECENWMTSQRYFSPKTQIIALQPENNGTFTLNAHSLRDRFPLRETQQPSLQSDLSQPISALKIEATENARAALHERPQSGAALKTLMANAKEAYLNNKTAEFSRRNEGASVAFSVGEPVTAARFEWKNRWYQAPDLLAAAIGYQKYYNPAAPQANRIEAVAYYGEDDSAPMVFNLGRMAQGRRGGLDTMVMVVENDVIKLRTIADYMPMTYISQTYKKQTTEPPGVPAA